MGYELKNNLLCVLVIDGAHGKMYVPISKRAFVNKLELWRSDDTFCCWTGDTQNLQGLQLFYVHDFLVGFQCRLTLM